MTTPRQRKTPEHGATAKTVSRNVRMMREAQGISARKLSELTAELGHPIPLEAIRKIEALAPGGPGGRRVSTDDLMVLARSLNTSPLSLLLPLTDDPYETVEVTGIGTQTAAAAWRWADGASPISEPATPTSTEHGLGGYQRSALFRAYARPGWLTS